MTPAMPAAGMQCPIIDLTDPIATPARGSCPAQTRPIASTSVPSPTTVPVPCASSRPMLAGVTPARW